ncbi:MAG: glycosyltransferase family 4 protein [Gemmatimonadales bacterium]
MRTEVEVLLVSATPPPIGGVASWTRTFLALAPDYGIRIRHYETRVEGARLSPRGLWRVVRVTLGPVGSLLLGRGRGADVVHVTAGTGGGLLRASLLAAAARVLGKAAVVHLHSRLHTASPIERRAMGLAIRLGARVVTPSEADARGEHRLAWIGNLIAPEFASGSPWRLAARRGLRLVYVGWLIHAKGLSDLVRAVARAPGVEVDLIGPVVRPSEAREIETLIDQLQVGGRVRIREPLPVAELRAAMLEYDALVLPSHRESFGLVAAEAMAIGLPVAATRTGMLETAPDETFHAVPIGNADGLATALERLMADRDRLLPGLSDAGRRFVDRAYSPAAIFDGWLALYHRALGRPAAELEHAQAGTGAGGR